MLRVIVRGVFSLPDGTHAGNVMRTFEIHDAALEEYLNETLGAYSYRWVDGVEIIPEKKPE